MDESNIPPPPSSLDSSSPSFRPHLPPLPETTGFVTSLEPLPETKAFVAEDAPPPPPPESPKLMGSPYTGGGFTPRGHRKNTSSLSDISLIEIITGKDGEAPELHVLHGSDVIAEGATSAGTSNPAMIIPKSTLLVVTDTAHIDPTVFADGTSGDGAAFLSPGEKYADGDSSSHLVNSSFTVSGTTQLLQDMVHDITEFDFDNLDGYKFQVKDWDGKKHYSDYIAQGLRYKRKDADKKKAELEAASENVDVTTNSATTALSKTMSNASNIYSDNIVMLFDSPTSSTSEFAFHNASKFRFHDWPPPSKTGGKSVLGPCRYALMSGNTYPVFLKDGAPPPGLLEHWSEAVPGFVAPTFVDKITDEHTVYAYLPVEQIRHHVNDPDVHYHLAGKDAIHLMTQKVRLCVAQNVFICLSKLTRLCLGTWNTQTTELLMDTKTVRPCVVKTTHSMGSKGIFIIQNDEDEAEFEKFYEESGHPTYVVTGFVDIARNVACHFFMHHNGSVTWFGSNENHRQADGSFSSDSYLIMEHQEKLKELQLPFVEEVVQYCHGLGFFGFCGIDVLFDSKDRGYLVDINPRITGSCPALMTLKRLSMKYNFTCGIFRRSGKDATHQGHASSLLEQVAAYNLENEGKSRVVIHSLYQNDMSKPHTRVNIGVYGTNLNECKTVLNHFAHAKKA
jgi:ATP-grasp domain